MYAKHKIWGFQAFTAETQFVFVSFYHINSLRTFKMPFEKEKIHFHNCLVCIHFLVFVIME